MLLHPSIILSSTKTALGVVSYAAMYNGSLALGVGLVKIEMFLRYCLRDFEGFLPFHSPFKAAIVVENYEER